ncbi:MAG TPA: HEPN domain-containing protein [Verrucomicrobiae bacterium]
MLTDPKNPRHWFNLADKDLERAHRRFAEPDFNDCLFHLQQCAEKTMKGRLVAVGWPLQKTHDLGALSTALLSYGVDCSWFEDAADVLATEYIADRYPGFDDQPPDAAELRQLVQDTRKLFEELSGRMYAGPELPS